MRPIFRCKKILLNEAGEKLMLINKNIFKTFIDLVTAQSRVEQLTKDLIKTNNNINKLDKRLVRIETFFEVMKMQKKSLHLE